MRRLWRNGEEFVCWKEEQYKGMCEGYRFSFFSFLFFSFLFPLFSLPLYNDSSSFEFDIKYY